MTETTMGIDIGTTSVKAVVADADGTILDRIRVPHRIDVPEPGQFQHDADQAWRRGPRRAFAKLAAYQPRAVAVSSMVPSLTAVDRGGKPQTPGLLYGDIRGTTGSSSNPGESGEASEFLRWTVGRAPDAAGYWSAQAVANFGLGAEAVLDFGTAFTMAPLFGSDGEWSTARCEACGVAPARLPRVSMMGEAVGHVRPALAGPSPVVLATGSVDAMCEQLVAGADDDGDVLVLCGTTLIMWAVVPEWRDVPGLWTVPHTAAGKCMLGGASNAGGLFLNWVDRVFGRADAAPDRLHPDRIPVWSPYIRGERTPFHDPTRRAVLDGLELSHGAAEIRRAAYEAAGFVVRHHLDLAGAPTRRIVATGGGTRVDGWMQALADCTGLPVEVAAVPEGAALGAAFLARVAVGLETSMNDASRWARTQRTVEPDPQWVEAAHRRYERFLALAGAAK